LAAASFKASPLAAGNLSVKRRDFGRVSLRGRAAALFLALFYFYPKSMRFLRALLPLAIISFGLASCEKEETAQPNPEHFFTEYFPLKPGHYVTYNVDSTIWDDFRCLKTVHTMQMRYTVADTFTDLQGRRSYRIDIMRRETDSVGWVDDEVIYVTPTTSRLEYVQKNLRFIKLIFPVAEGTYWNGNSLISASDQDYQYFADWVYKYTRLGQAFQAPGGKYYPATVTVEGTDQQQNDPETQPNAYSYRTYLREVYAKDAGLVWREQTRWIYDPGVKKCRKGYSVTMYAVDNN